jgi:hypothetical protein
MQQVGSRVLAGPNVKLVAVQYGAATGTTGFVREGDGNNLNNHMVLRTDVKRSCMIMWY